MPMDTASRGKVLFVPEAKILYRQHESNVTAWKSSFSYLEYFMALLKRKLTPDRDITTIMGFFHQAKELRKHLKGLSAEIPQVLDVYINAVEKGGITSAFSLILSGIHQPAIIPNLQFLFRIARGRHVALLKRAGTDQN